MKDVVPPFNLRCLRGSRWRGAITAARMRNSRLERVTAGVVVTKKFLLEPVLLWSERLQPVTETVGWERECKRKQEAFRGFPWHRHQTAIATALVHHL
jgi:hypothetical protein